MEKKTVQHESSGGYHFSFGRAIVGGFFATLLLEILIYLQGQNPALTLGGMILGPEANMSYIYAVGGGFCLLVGIVYALLYALILAPMRFISDFIQGILLAAILTAIAIFMFPKMQSIFDTVLGKHTEVEAQSVAKAPEEPEKGTEVATTKEVVQNKDEGQSNLDKEDNKKQLLNNFMNHLIYAFALIVIYRQSRKLI